MQASLIDDNVAGDQEDPVSRVFDALRDEATKRGVTEIKFTDAEALALHKGFSTEHFEVRGCGFPGGGKGLAAAVCSLFTAWV